MPIELPYSLDKGKTWVEPEVPAGMYFDHTRLFMGQKFAIFNYATLAPGCHVDVPDFTYE